MACKTTIQTEIELHLRNLDNAWQKFTFISFSIFNPLISKSDWLLISPNSITFDSNITVMRIREMITHQRDP